MKIRNNFFAQKAYWLNKLSGELPETNLIPDYIRPVLYSGQTKFITFELPSDLAETINKITKGSYFSIYLVLLSALSILLKKYTKNSDIVVGSPTYKQEDCAGFDNQIVPLRLNVSDQLTFKDLLVQAKNTTIGAYCHQNYPFDELIQLLKLPQLKNRCPIFDIVVLLENIHGQNSIPNISNDITISFLVEKDVIRCTVNYDQSLFRDETIKLMNRYYVNLLKNIFQNINAQVSSIDILQEFDKQQLLKKFNDNDANYPVEQTIHKLFEAQVSQTPNKIAVVHEETQFTYQQLNEKANQLARFLQNLGVRKGEFVGILKERDANFLIAILAILKVGGVYVPLDSTYPPERIRYVLSNSEVRVLLTNYSFLSFLKKSFEYCPHLKSLVCLDENNPVNTKNASLVGINIYNNLDFNNISRENLDLSDRGSEPAYMIYTSGSTGLPKGAIIKHGSAINHIYGQFQALEFTEDYSFLQSAPASSDISVWQFLAPVLIGGKTVIVESETVSDPEKLFKVIKEEKVSIVELVPIVLTGLLNYVDRLPIQQRLLPDLKWMMVTGESVSVELVNQWLRLYPSIRIVNAYGPTEAADDITQLIIEKPLSTNQRTVSIGKPLANLNLYILDSQMNLVPIGVPGEICVSGYGVGEGYWKNKEKTNLSFAPNPFPSTAKPLPGTNRDLIYKTGDLGRWLPDGSIEFLGRIDHQVKIRGFRIELGEIEALLGQHTAVRETVVVVREDNPGNKRLVAYIVPHLEGRELHEDGDNQHPTEDSIITSELIPQLRNFLKQKLPEYMMPSAFVLLESLPIAPSGKVDRKALPAPDPTQLSSQSHFVAAATPVEEMLAGIWAQVLGLDRVSIQDNFFALGGHSLLATRIISQVRQVFKVELPLRRLFESPTVAELAKDIEIAVKGDLGLRVPPIERVSREGNLPLSFAQQRLWFLAQLEPDDPAYNIPVAVRLKGQLDVKALEQSLNEVIKRHETLRTSFITVDGQPFQAIAPTLTLTLPIINLSDWHPPEREIEARRLVIEGALQPFDLAQCGLLRFTLLRLDAEEHIILLTMHHIVSDAWSMGVLVQEIAASYKAFCGDKPGLGDAALTPLPELPIQYADFAVWQREWLQGEVLQTQLNYWKQQLGSTHPRLALPTTPLHSTIKTNRGARQSFVLSKDLTEAITLISRQEEVTLFMTLLAAFQASLYCFTGTEDIRVGSPIANRNLVEIEGLIGCFVNTLVLRIDLSGNPSFRELLVRSRQITLEAYTHQDLPFEKLVEELQPDRNLSHNPLYQAWFVLQNAPMPSLELPSLTLSPLEIDSGTARHDLLLSISESPEGIKGTFEYRTHLLEKAVIAQLVRYLETLLRQVTNQPDTRLKELSEMLAEIDREQQFSQKIEIQNAERQKLKMSKRKGIRN
jgi:surfactin family lipopeptide synthetase A